MPDALAAWKAKAVSEPITLPSGTVVTLRLPSIRDCLVTGKLQLSILTKLAAAVDAAKENGSQVEMTPEEMEQDAMLDRAMISRAVATVDGEPVSLTLDDARVVPPRDAADILAYCVRELAIPKAS